MLLFLLFLALSGGGTVFTQAQLPVSVCRPSLQTLLSGLHPAVWKARRFALGRQQPLGMRQEVAHFRTLPRELERLGYRSWQGGKMWEGTFAQAGFEDGTARVLDQTRAGINFVIDGSDFGRTGWQPSVCGVERWGNGPCPAMGPLRRFLDDLDGEPFFLWFAPMLPHRPFDAPEPFMAPYLGALRAGAVDLSTVSYFAQVTRLDAVVGELVRLLDARGVLDDTLIVYLSDNGWEIGSGFFGRSGTGRGKGSLHALGTRTPLVVRWPGRVPAGVRRADLVSSEDLFPTFLDYAGGEPLPDRRGSSLRHAIETGEPFERDRYVSFHDGNTDEHRGTFVRTPRWRYIQANDGREELYEIATDPMETVDLAAARPDLVARFREDVLAWNEAITRAPPRLEIGGRLVTAGGEPIGFASLRLESKEAQEEAQEEAQREAQLQVVTDANGAFRFQNLRHGDYHLAAARGVEALAEEVAVSIPVGPTGSYLPQVVGLPGERLPPSRTPWVSTISGHLERRSGEPVADAVVVLRHLKQALDLEIRVLTDSDGRYLAENLPEGAYLVRAEREPGLRTAHSRYVPIGRAQHRVLDLVASPWPRVW